MSSRLFFFFLLCMGHSLHAQLPAPLRFEKIEGLSQSTGYSITQDRQGFLWIATANGLNRYDGMEMKSFKPSLEKKPFEMEGRVIRSRLLEDDQDRIWFSTDIALHSYDKKKDRFFTFQLDNKKRFANPLVITGNQLWLANAGDGIFEFDITTGLSVLHPLQLRDAAGNLIQLMYHGAYDGNSLWFASRQGLVSFNLSSKKWQLFLSGHSFYALAFSSDTIYVSEGRQLNWFALRSLQHGKCLISPHQTIDLIHCVYADPSGNILIGDESGNVYQKSRTGEAVTWRGNINGNHQSRTKFPVYSLHADASGMVWAGAYALGLLRAEPGQQFRSFPGEGKPEGHVFVNSIYENNDGKIWLGTFENGVLVLDPESGHASPIQLPYNGPDLPYGNSVPLIQEDSRGTVWTSLSGYLFIREKGSRKFLQVKMPPPSNALQVPQMWSLSEHQDGWLVGTTVGLYRVTKKGSTYSVQHLSHLGQDRILQTWTAPDNTVWIAYESGGIGIVKGPVEKSLPFKSIFSQSNVRQLHYDPDRQLLWIASSSGLITFHFPTGTYKNFTTADGLLNDYVYGMLHEKEQLWISTNYGLSKAVVDYSTDSVLPRIRFVNFTSSDGLIDNVFNARAFHKGRSGLLYFGTPKGLNWFLPEAIHSTQRKPVVRMIELLVNDAPPDSLRSPAYIAELDLPHDRNNLFFRFRAVDFTDPEKIQYAYKLQGWDKDWIFSRRSNEVRYANLPHGNYVFQVKAADGSGRWSEASLDVMVSIRPPFWRTWWFYLLGAVLVLTGAILLTRMLAQRKLRRRLNALEKQRAVELERNRISKDMHDEIGSGLTHIALLSELMQTQNKPGGEMKKDVGQIASFARQLVVNMSEIIWALNPHNDSLENLLSYLREQTIQFFEPFDLQYTVDFPIEVPALPLSNVQRRNLYLVAKEALNNALKHSVADCIQLSMRCNNNELLFVVSDNGKGFAAAAQSVGANGLRNIKKRIEDIGGHFELHTGKEGTRVLFSLEVSQLRSRDTTFFTSAKEN